MRGSGRRHKRSPGNYMVATEDLAGFGERGVAGLKLRSRDPATRNEPKQDPFTMSRRLEERFGVIVSRI